MFRSSTRFSASCAVTLEQRSELWIGCMFFLSVGFWRFGQRHPVGRLKILVLEVRAGRLIALVNVPYVREPCASVPCFAAIPRCSHPKRSVQPNNNVGHSLFSIPRAYTRNVQKKRRS